MLFLIFLPSIYMDGPSVDFSSFLGCSRYDFGADTPYINVTSIEQYYAKIYGYDNQKCVFVNWLKLNNSVIEEVFDHLRQSGDVGMPDLTHVTNSKVDYLVRRPTNKSATIHPLIAIMFTIDISPKFSILIISRIAGMVHKNVISNYIKLANMTQQSNAHWQAVIDEKNKKIDDLRQELFLHKQRVDVLTVELQKASCWHCISRLFTFRYRARRNGFRYK
jgi:hypothetical protein